MESLFSVFCRLLMSIVLPSTVKIEGKGKHGSDLKHADTALKFTEYVGKMAILGCAPLVLSEFDLHPNCSFSGTFLILKCANMQLD